MLTRRSHEVDAPAILVDAIGAAIGLNGRTLVTSGSDARLLIDAAHRHRVIGVLAHGALGGVIDLPDPQMEQLADAHEELMRRSLVIDRLLIDASDRLPVEDCCVVKGVACAHLDYPDPAARTYQDVDLLVRASRIDDVVRTLQTLEYERELPPRGPTWDRRFAKDLTLYSPTGPELDIHRTLVPGAFGHWIDADDLIDHAETVIVGDVEFRALDRSGRIIHAAYAMTIGESEPRLSHALDLALLVLGDVDGSATASAIERLERWHAGTLLADAWAAVAAAFPVDRLLFSPGGRSLTTLEPAATLRARLAIAGYRSHGGSNTTTLLLGVLGMDSPMSGASYLRQLIVPTRAYRRARRAAGRSAEWRTGLRELVRIRT